MLQPFYFADAVVLKVKMCQVRGCPEIHGLVQFIVIQIQDSEVSAQRQIILQK